MNAYLEIAQFTLNMWLVVKGDGGARYDEGYWHIHRYYVNPIVSFLSAMTLVRLFLNASRNYAMTRPSSNKENALRALLSSTS